MDRYHLFQEIGRGRLSQVYKGREKQGVEFFAIKRVDKSRMAAVVHEVHMMHRLVDSHCLMFFDWYETRNNLWLIMEYAAGGTLMSLLRQDGPMPEEAVKVFGVDLMAGLLFLHSTGLVYCDLKPSNILLDEYGVLKYSDFELCRYVPETDADLAAPPVVSVLDTDDAEDEEHAAASDPVHQRGTPHYMAPELFREDGVLSFASDLWSLGIVLFELRTGRLPFREESLRELMRVIFHEAPSLSAPASAPQTAPSHDLTDLVLWLLEKDCQQRGTWPEALAHPFWDHFNPPPLRPLPPQPLFDARAAAWREAPPPIAALDPRESLDTDAIARMSLQARDLLLHHQASEQQVLAPAPETPHENGNGASATTPSHPLVPGDIPLAALANAAPGQAQPTLDGDVLLPSADCAVTFPSGQPLSAPSGIGSVPAASTASQEEEEEEEPLSPLAGDAEPGEHHSDSDGPSDSDGDGFEALRPQTPPSPVAAPGLASAPSTSASCPSRRPYGAAGRAFAGLTQPEDFRVSPIVGNPKIESLRRPRVDPETLPFSAHPPSHLEGLGPTELQQFFTQVFRALGHRGPHADQRLKVVTYLRIAAQSANAANCVINSNLLPLLLRFLQRLTRASSKARLLACLGALLRHATLLSPPPPSRGPGLLAALTDLAQQGAVDAPAPRRAAVAALGELLFYIATQPPTQDRAWRLPSATLNVLAQALADPDPIVAHYAAKTLENVLAQAPTPVAQRFLRPPTLAALLDLWLATPTPPAAATAAAALAHAVLHLVLQHPSPPELGPVASQRMGPAPSRTLRDPPPASRHPLPVLALEAVHATALSQLLTARPAPVDPPTPDPSALLTVLACCLAEQLRRPAEDAMVLADVYRVVRGNFCRFLGYMLHLAEHHGEAMIRAKALTTLGLAAALRTEAQTRAVDRRLLSIALRAVEGQSAGGDRVAAAAWGVLEVFEAVALVSLAQGIGEDVAASGVDPDLCHLVAAASPRFTPEGLEPLLYLAQRRVSRGLVRRPEVFRRLCLALEAEGEAPGLAVAILEAMAKPASRGDSEGEIGQVISAFVMPNIVRLVTRSDEHLRACGLVLLTTYTVVPHADPDHHLQRIEAVLFPRIPDLLQDAHPIPNFTATLLRTLGEREPQWFRQAVAPHIPDLLACAYPPETYDDGAELDPDLLEVLCFCFELDGEGGIEVGTFAGDTAAAALESALGTSASSPRLVASAARLCAVLLRRNVGGALGDGCLLPGVTQAIHELAQDPADGPHRHGPAPEVRAEGVRGLARLLRAHPPSESPEVADGMGLVLGLPGTGSEDIDAAVREAMEAVCGLALRIASAAPLALHREPLWGHLRRYATGAEPTVASRKAAKAVALVRRARERDARGGPRS